MTDPEAPTWLTEATRAIVAVLAGQEHYSVIGESGKVITIGEDLHAVAERAVRAAAPIIRRAAEQERDFAKRTELHAVAIAQELSAKLAHVERERDSLARRCAVRFEGAEALRAQLADARRATLNEAADAADDWLDSWLPPSDRRVVAERLRERAKGGSE